MHIKYSELAELADGRKGTFEPSNGNTAEPFDSMATAIWMY
jgi:hypothetical protein